MPDRRSLTEGLHATPPSAETLQAEKTFVFQNKGKAPASPPAVSRVPFSTRLRADLTAALKRASLERQLQNIEPNSLTDIVEQAIEPWLRSNGYIP